MILVPTIENFPQTILDIQHRLSNINFNFIFT